MLSVNMSIIYTIINLLILYVFFRKFLFGRVEKILKERREAIENAGKDLEKELAETRQSKERYDAEAKALKDNQEAAIAEWRGKGFEEYNRIVEEAKVEAGRILADARKDAVSEAGRIREKNQEELKELVLDAAARISGHTADRADDGALYDQFIRELDAAKEPA